MASATVPPIPSGDAPKLPPAIQKAPALPKVPAANVVKGGPPPMAAPLNSLLPGDGSGIEGEEQEEMPHHPAGFWNQPWVQNVLPLATSLLLHVSIIGVGILFFGIYKHVEQKIKEQEQTVIPEASSIEKTAMPGGIPHPGLNNDPTRDAAQDEVEKTDNKGFSTNPDTSVSAALGGGTSDAESNAFAGNSSSTGKGQKGAGGSGNDFGGGSGGGTAPWGVPGGGAGGLLPKSNFMGTGGNGRDIIYLCDASGSMLSVFGALKQNLKESIQNLSVQQGQKFNVIFFSDDNCFPLFKELTICSPPNKAKAMEFVDNAVSTGGTQPIPAIKEAMKEKPQMLYVLTDGFDQIANFDDVINAFKNGNTDGKMHINCIFLQSDEDPKLEQVLKQISDQGHGSFNKILKKDM